MLKYKCEMSLVKVTSSSRFQLEVSYKEIELSLPDTK